MSTLTGTGKLVPVLAGDELVEMLGWPDAPPLELDDFVSVPSFDVHGELALSLARRVVEHAARPAVRGVVVPHGTDTMEESVYLVDRLLASDTPVVFTGAQRGADQADADGPRNLRDAIRLAASEDARGYGALVMFAGEIHAAREVTKTSTYRLQTFRSPDFGVLGHADGDAIAYYRRPVRRRAPDTEFDIRSVEALPRVDIVYAYTGSDGTAVRAGHRTNLRRAWRRLRARGAVRTSP